jgi:hypothetical protein
MPNKLLITRPDHDQTTRYISAWALKVKDFAEKKGVTVFDLKKERAKKKVFESMIKKQDPDLVFLNGHGSSNKVAGQDDEILAEVGKNEEIFCGRVVYSLSCSSGKELGPAWLKKGVKAFIGYREDFIFLYDEKLRTRPEQDKAVAEFLDPSNQVVISLLKGHSPNVAHQNSRAAFFHNIRKMISSQASAIESATVRYLIWDMQNQICLE